MPDNLIPKPVHQFPPLPGGLTLSSKLAVPQRSSQDQPNDYHTTMAEVKQFLESVGMIAVPAGEDEYVDDVAAGSGGVGIGKFYVLAQGNSYNLPAGLPKKRTV